MADWSDLPRDLLGCIAQRVIIYEDFVALGGVCSSWRSVAVKENFTPSPHLLPWLTLAEKKNKNKNSNTRAFFSLSKGMVQERSLPKACGKRCWGSHGWLITFSIDLNITLLNPLTGVEIQLPHHRTFKDHYVFSDADGEDLDHIPAELQEIFIVKAILSSSPSSTSDYVVMVIHGALLVVSRYISYGDCIDEANAVHAYQTTEFRVFEPDLGKSNGGEWVEVKNLGDKALFLGHSYSMSIVASDFPNCKANCIYFTDDLEETYYGHPDGGGEMACQIVKSVGNDVVLQLIAYEGLAFAEKTKRSKKQRQVLKCNAN
ncbi:hypothetical protein HHK36_000244 [Tetracentron sinense]|uniref:KIB1-4 beta-propeller domain-containing protein n=1 Tax=Tetracentron sinense TaxID=13715 RepID=A0A834ZW16_TETSI|nr:hypothetical protein HHK36_000244 [Tetracentron sinense]